MASRAAALCKAGCPQQAVKWTAQLVAPSRTLNWLNRTAGCTGNCVNSVWQNGRPHGVRNCSRENSPLCVDTVRRKHTKQAAEFRGLAARLPSFFLSSRAGRAARCRAALCREKDPRTAVSRTARLSIAARCGTAPWILQHSTRRVHRRRA